MTLERSTWATYSFFAQDGWEETMAAELKAFERICGLAHKETGDFLVGLGKEFDAGESDEARFAKAHRSRHARAFEPQPKRRKLVGKCVSYERVVELVRPEIENGCPELWEHLKPQLEAGRRKGFFATSES
jgi:putative hydrolase of HD superfamily